IEALAERVGAELVWEPVLLGGILRAVGSPDVPASRYAPARVAIEDANLVHQAELRGAPLSRHPRHPLRTLDAMRLITSAPPATRPALSRALFEAYHVENRDITDRSELAAIAADHGLDLDAIDDPDVKADLRRRTEHAVSLGIFGVPTLWARTDRHPEGRFWWGVDRLHIAEAALMGATTRDAAPAPLDRDGAVPRSPPPLPVSAPARVELYHDFSSPFSYLASTQARRITEEHGATLVWRPMLLGALFRDIGAPMVPLHTMPPAKARYMLTDLHDWSAWWGVPFSFPSCFPVRTITALRAALVEPRLTPVLYAALWVDGQDIGDDEVLARVIRHAGFDDEAILAATRTPAVKDALRANTEAAARIGACGAPTWRIIGPSTDGPPLPDLVIWGQDRADVIHAALEGWRPQPR
ncbi:MAG: hypothetical protein D6798_19240, partial [Deltaproteobacteria bacterium]